MISRKESEAIRVFLTDLYHRKHIERAFRKIRESLPTKVLKNIIDDLRSKEIIDNEETEYLLTRLNIS